MVRQFSENRPSSDKMKNKTYIIHSVRQKIIKSKQTCPKLQFQLLHNHNLCFGVSTEAFIHYKLHIHCFQ